MDTADVLKLWEAGADVRDRMAKVKTYYDGEVKLRELYEKRLDGRDKSRVLRNWTKYAARLHAGFMTGTPVAYSHRDGADSDDLKAFQNFVDQESLAATDTEHYRNALLYGYSVEIHAFEDGRPRVATTWPWDWVFVANERGEVVKGLHRQAVPKFTQLETGEIAMDDMVVFRLYTDREIVTYHGTAKGLAGSSGNTMVEASDIDEAAGQLTEVNRERHVYNVPPLVVFRVSEDGKPFFQDDFFQQCDSYDITRSSMQDDIKHAVDSMLMTKGMKYEKLLEKDKDGLSVLAKLRAEGFLPLPDGADASYLTRVVDVDKFRADLSESRSAIHSMACVPDLEKALGSEGTITNISGVALKLLFYVLILASAEMQKHFLVGLRRRIDVWNQISGLAYGVRLENVAIAMKMNLPFNELEIVQYMPNLDGVLATEDKLKLLPFVDSPAQAAENLRKEKATMAGPEREPTEPNSEAIA
jgi:SPP1 family phage portal protein